MYSAVVEYQPFLSHVLLLVTLLFSQFICLLLYSKEKLLQEIQVLVLAICALYDPPMSQSFFRNNCNQRKPFTLGNWAVYSYLLVRSRPSFVTSHIKIKTTFIQKVYFSVFHANIFVFDTIMMSFLYRFRCISLFRHTFHSFLLKLPHFQQSSYCCPINLYSCSVFHILQVLYFIQLYCQFILGQKRIFFYQSGYMLQSLKYYLSLRSFLFEVFPSYSFVKGWVLNPLCIQFMNSAITHIKKLTNLPDCHSWSFIIQIILSCVIIIKFCRQKFQGFFGQSSFSFRKTTTFSSCSLFKINIQISELSILSFLLKQLFFKLFLDSFSLLLHVLSFIFIILLELSHGLFTTVHCFQTFYRLALISRKNLGRFTRKQYFYRFGGSFFN